MAEEQDGTSYGKKKNNILPLYGNDSMNLNSLILTNIQSSVYFKVTLFQLKTYHEVIDEIFYQVKHLEPWERGSRKTSGNSGMCGSVRGVGAGGIVSSAFCLLYKLYTLKLTRKQVNGLITHNDSPFIRGLGFMYIRYTQPPADLFDWYEDFLQDDEEIDVKAGGGGVLTIGQMCRQLLTKLDWFSTLFPRIPVPIQKQIEMKLANYDRENGIQSQQTPVQQQQQQNRFGSAGGGGGGGGQMEARRDFKNWDRERPAKDSYRDEHRRRSRSREKRKYEKDESYSRHSRRSSHSRERYSAGGGSSSSKSKYQDRSRSRSRDRKDRKKYDYDDARSSKRY